MVYVDKDKIVNMNAHWWKGIEQHSKQTRWSPLCPLTSDNSRESIAQSWRGQLGAKMES